MDEVEFWVRNISQSDYSFWLPTATDKFYPDFVAKLKDGRILVVEYKGAHLVSNDDSKEKQMIGELWARKSNGAAIFLMAVKRDLQGRDVMNQLRAVVK